MPRADTAAGIPLRREKTAQFLTHAKAPPRGKALKLLSVPAWQSARRRRRSLPRGAAPAGPASVVLLRGALFSGARVIDRAAQRIDTIGEPRTQA